MADKFSLVNAKNETLTETQFWQMLNTAPMSQLNYVFSPAFLQRINMCAKYKPVKISGHVRNANYWRGEYGDCGISIPILNSLSEIGTKNWTYDYPQGGVGETEPCNLQDFWYWGRYQHFATPVISSGYQSAIKWNRLVTTSITINARYNHSMSDSPILGIDDIPNLSSKFYALAVGANAPDPAMAKSANLNLANKGFEITLTSEEIWRAPLGRTNIWFFLSDMQVRWGEPYAAYGKRAIYSNSSYINPVPLDIVEESPITATFLRIRNQNRIWQDFNSVVLVEEGQLNLVEVRFTNIFSEPVDIPASQITTITTGGKDSLVRGIDLNTNIDGTNRLTTLSLTAHQSKTFYTWVDFQSERWPKPEISATIEAILATPSVTAISIGIVNLIIK